MGKFGLASAILSLMVGHTQPRNLAFEVLSVKPSGTNQTISMGPSAPSRSHVRGFRYSGQRVTCDLTLKEIIQEAYSLKEFQIVGPGWLAIDTYAITAIIPTGSTKESAPVMLRTMLEERFGLRFHREQRDLPVYALVEAKGGFKLQPIADPEKQKERVLVTASGRPMPGATVIEQKGQFTAAAMSVGGFAESLSRKFDLPVVNLTAISGVFEIDLRWMPDPSGQEGSPDMELMRAIERQLGLKLEKRKLPYDTFSIDRVEKVPTEN